MSPEAMLPSTTNAISRRLAGNLEIAAASGITRVLIAFHSISNTIVRPLRPNLRSSSG
ncbi:Uncharacterised protein [Vibrio cholerae]|nr:Uncharacterised protein [Vibrio cholerae]CSB61873.1 Uncharacterised protein [Vibrio cholerae]CSC68235.1 Uncharacterised protein [Vibrio cholerae]CSI80170.1 Uncharacterised protein [Vibrio cholerae]